MVEKSNLYTNIMDKLRYEPSIDESDITISIKDDGIVILGGTVQSYTEKYLAEKAVEKIENVKGIANELEVDLFSGYKRSDADIVAAALNGLKWKTLVPFEKIKVIVEKGHLTLEGEVEYNYQKERAEEAVKDLYGVILISNDIKVVSKVSPFEVKEKIKKEFERNALIDANKIQVEIDGGIVTLKGKVRNFEEL